MTTPKIYADKLVAELIANTLSKATGTPHTVVPVTTGHQVCPVKVLKPAVPPAKPLPVAKPETKGKLADMKLKDGECLIALKFRGESPQYIDAWAKDGKPVSFGKSTLLGWEVAGENVHLKMTEAVAKKRGLIAADKAA